MNDFTLQTVEAGVTDMLEAFIGQGGQPYDFGTNINVEQLSNLIHNNLFPKIKETKAVDVVSLNMFSPLAEIVRSSGEIIEERMLGLLTATPIIQ